MALNKIAIFLRKTQKINRFRNIIQNTFYSSTITEMIICSGFFQEDKHFKASDSFKSSRKCNTKSLKLVGLYSYTWKKSFNDFVSNVKCHNCTCLRIKKYKISGMKWHAKIMIGKIDNSPAVAVIGSSNMTGRAFGIYKYFNYECDVVLWDDSIPSIKQAMNLSIEEFRENSDEIIISEYSEDDPRNGNLSLTKKIKKLEEDIFRVAKEINDENI